MLIRISETHLYPKFREFKPKFKPTPTPTLFEKKHQTGFSRKGYLWQDWCWIIGCE